MTKAERLAYRSILVQGKLDAGYDENLLADLKTNDPEASSLMADGEQLFLRRVRDRILREHGDSVFLNRCPKCGGLAKTPKAQQCHWCHHDWHCA